MFCLKRLHVFLKRLGIFRWQEQEEGGSTPATHYALSLNTLPPVTGVYAKSAISMGFSLK